MKTFAKRLKAERTQNSILRRENEILKKLLRNKNTELKKANLRLSSSEKWIYALAGMIGENFILAQTDLNSPRQYEFRITKEGNIEFSVKGIVDIN